LAIILAFCFIHGFACTMLARRRLVHRSKETDLDIHGDQALEQRRTIGFKDEIIQLMGDRFGPFQGNGATDGEQGLHDHVGQAFG
jgi:hypothetical protein